MIPSRVPRALMLVIAAVLLAAGCGMGRAGIAFDFRFFHSLSYNSRVP